MTVEEEKELRTFAISESSRTPELTKEKAPQAVDLCIAYLKTLAQTSEKYNLEFFLRNKRKVTIPQMIQICQDVYRILDQKLKLIRERNRQKAIEKDKKAAEQRQKRKGNKNSRQDSKSQFGYFRIKKTKHASKLIHAAHPKKT